MQRETALQVLAELTTARADAAAEFEDRDLEWRAGIKAALAAGCTRTEIAAEAGITRQRVVQIAEDRR